MCLVSHVDFNFGQDQGQSCFPCSWVAVEVTSRLSMPLSWRHQSTRGSKMSLVRPARMPPSLMGPICTICGSELIIGTLCSSGSVAPPGSSFIRHRSGSVLGFHSDLFLPPNSTVVEALHASLLKWHPGPVMRTRIRDSTSAFQSPSAVEPLNAHHMETPSIDSSFSRLSCGINSLQKL